MDLIKKNFQGKTPLWQVFWIQNVLIGGGLQFGVDKIGPSLSTAPLYILITFNVIYGIWVFAGLWQCAFNAEWRGWGYIIRGVYVLVIGLVIISLLRGI
ncbi:hypothetical protein LZP73_02290 [Shewanella sp. AS16]|uniref:hypothetical protein n=1 Tax=Shewanella sp. AS16 TaxID=2907625 RepID=UPI001F4355C1|nr:hypothetical protein [Shewanella sp. AS16]MCE9685039.1 hypothetical protein [Shewanella sp. AS16]